MDPVFGLVVCTVLALLIVAVAATLVVRFSLRGAESRDRARILTAVAEVIRALRGKR